MKIRRLVTLTVFISFAFLSYSGILLFFSPQGRVANWGGWMMLGLTREQYVAVHTAFMVLFLAAAIWHIVLNWKAFVHYLRNRAKKVRVFTPEFTTAFVLCLVVFAGTLIGLPPFQQLLNAGEGIKAYWEGTEGSPPWGHAEESRFDRFCLRMEDYVRIEEQRQVIIDCDLAVGALREAGIQVEDQSQTLLDIARANGTTPQVMAEIVVGVATEGRREVGVEEHAGPYAMPYSGLGRMTMREYAERYETDLETILTILRESGVELDADARLREEATRLGKDPEGIITLLNEGAGNGRTP